MTNTYRSLLRTIDQVASENPGTWGDYVDTNFSLLESAIAGETLITTTGGATILSVEDGAVDEQRRAVIRVAGLLTSNAVIQVPATPKTYDVINQTTGSYTTQIRTATQTGQDIPQGGAARVAVQTSGTVSLVAKNDPSASSSIEHYLGPATVNLTSTTAVSLGTTPSTGRFLPLEVILYCSSAFSPTAVSNVTLGIGQTGAAYTDWSAQTLSDSFNAGGEVVRYDLAGVSTPLTSAPASTEIYAKPDATISSGEMSVVVRVRGIIV